MRVNVAKIQVFVVQLSFVQLFAPIASISLLVVGSGYYTTFTSMHLKEAAIATWMIGCIQSAHFSGFVISSFLCQRFIFRVGHIRAFSAFAALLGFIALIQGVIFSPSLWIVLRFAAGFCLAGVCVIIESWLMACSDLKTRGTVLAIYMFTYYGAQALSQLFFEASFASYLVSYALITAFICISILPVCVTRFSAPCPDNPLMLSFKFLWRKAQLGVVGCVTGGLILGCLYALVPVYLEANQIPNHFVGRVMFAIIFGGTLLQYPIGKLSDRMDRRKVLALMLIACMGAFSLFIVDYYNTTWLIALGALMGASSFIVYPLSISYTIDHIENNQMVSAVASLLLAYGVGSTVGPLVCGFVMQWLGPNGLCYYLFVVSCFMCIYTVVAVLKQPKVTDEEEPLDFMAQPRTTPEAVPVDPEHPPVEMINENP